MVAPHDAGSLVRSLVRVPGSGSDRSAGSVCCDLARASSLAASVPVNPTLPAALVGNGRSEQPGESSSPRQHQPSEMIKMKGIAVAAPRLWKANVTISSPAATPAHTNTVSRKRPCSQESTVAANAQSCNQAETPLTPQAKRARVVCMTSQQVGENVKVALPPGTILVQFPRVVNNTPVMSQTTVAQLLQERNTLRRENLVLQQQLTLFRQLFKNKEKLTSVVKQLGINVA